MLTDRFVTVLADTPAARDAQYNLRYEIFCEETGYEDTARFPDRREQDAFDLHATHFIVWDRQQQRWAGAVRVVDGVRTALPMESIAAGSGARIYERPCAEISRLCIRGAYRQTPASVFFGLTGPQSDPEPVFFRQEDNEILMRLFWASIECTKASGIEHSYCIITGALTRVLRRMGMLPAAVGQPLQHRGIRIPSLLKTGASERGMMATLPGFRRLVSNGPAWVPWSALVASGEPIDNPAGVPQREKGPRPRPSGQAEGLAACG